jgi:outer membrane beta-barrel protein
LATSTPVFAYKRVTEGTEVVKNKKYPKKSKIELNGPNAGLILNSSYVTSILLNGGINYFFSENWGLGLEGTLALNQDKSERECIENFYNDPNQQIPVECGEAGNLTLDRDGDANFGPAYVPIRQINYIMAANAIWSPIYGKQIIMLSTTNYLDVYFSLGLGMAFSDFYDKRTNLKLQTNKSSRGSFCTKANRDKGLCNQPASANPGTTDPNEIGIEGRPEPLPESNPVLQFGVGQKFHFAKIFNFKIELRNYTLLGTQSGFENFFTLWGGLGLRF